MPQLKFNWVDFFFLTLLIRICYIGYKRGFLHEFFRVLGLIFAIVLAVNNYPNLSLFLGKWLKTSNSADIVSLISIFLGTLLVFKILSLITGFLIRPGDGPSLSRAVGLLLGIVRSGLLSSILLLIAIFSPIEYLQKSIKERSLFSPYIFKIAPITYKFAIKFYPGSESKNLLTEFLNK